MPDLTIEYYWMCSAYHEFMDEKTPSNVEPDCKWQQFYDGNELYNGRCPDCGGEVVSVPYAV